jgi:hypothetical protein
MTFCYKIFGIPGTFSEFCDKVKKKGLEKDVRLTVKWRYDGDEDSGTRKEGFSVALIAGDDKFMLREYALFQSVGYSEFTRTFRGGSFEESINRDLSAAFRKLRSQGLTHLSEKPQLQESGLLEKIRKMDERRNRFYDSARKENEAKYAEFKLSTTA